MTSAQYRHTSETLWIQFHTTAIKQVRQLFSFPVRIKALFTLYYSLINVQYMPTKQFIYLNFKNSVGAGGVTRALGPEFKPQYQQKNKNKNSTAKKVRLVI
jgi:hypothetical protein